MQVTKSQRQQEIERANGGRDIRLVIRDIYRETGTRIATARRLGITHQTLNAWIEDFSGVERVEVDLEFPGVEATEPVAA